MNRCSLTSTALIIATLLTIGVFTTSAFGWSQSFHAYTAKKCLNLKNNYLAGYNARLGAVTPDFFWYLRDKGWIDEQSAYSLHGPTEWGYDDSHTYFHEVSFDLLDWWNYRLIYFTEGIKTHVLADIIAHDLRDNTQNSYPDGYIEWWVVVLSGNLKELDDPLADDLDTVHLAVEFAVDSLLIKEHGLQLTDLLFSRTQTGFLENILQEILGSSFPHGLDVGEEFGKYLGLVRLLEKTAALYARCLIEGKVEEDFLNVLESREILEIKGEITEKAYVKYVQVLTILMKYPKEIYETLMGKESPNGEEIPNLMEILSDMNKFCKNM